MKKLKLIICTIIYICTLSIGLSQPAITLWKVDSNHEINTKDNIADYYYCGIEYYLHHDGTDRELHFSIKNEGNEDLQLHLPIIMSDESYSEFSVSEQPDKSILGPDEETHFVLLYTAPDKYYKGISARMIVNSNAYLNPECSFNVAVGNGDPGYCVCTENGPITRTESIGTVVDQDEIFNSEDACTGSESCPAISDVGCYTTKNFNTNRVPLFSMVKSEVPKNGDYLLIQEGYCPCEIPVDLDYCIDSPFPNPEGMVGLPICPGESFTVDTSSSCEDIIIIGPLIENALPSSYTFTWCINGFGTVTPFVDGDSAAVSDWQIGDFLFVKVFDGECMSVYGQRLGSELDYTIEQGQDGDLCNNGYKICVEPEEIIIIGDGGGNGDSEGIDFTTTWMTNGSGTFSEPFIEGIQSECVYVYGAVEGDLILFNRELSNGVLSFCNSIRTVICDPATAECDFTLNENLIVNGGPIVLDDPCNCLDPLNYEKNGNYYFHDILVVEGDMGFTANIENILFWFDDDGNPVTTSFMVSDSEDGVTDGKYEVDFWHIASTSAFADVTVIGGDKKDFKSSNCEPCPSTIPTLGQWGLCSLIILFLIFGMVFLKEKRQQPAQIC